MIYSVTAREQKGSNIWIVRECRRKEKYLEQSLLEIFRTVYTTQIDLQVFIAVHSLNLKNLRDCHTEVPKIAVLLMST